MKYAIAFSVLLLVPAVILAQPYYIELDLDGVLGNGPDVMSATVSDYITVDVWIMGTGLPLVSSNFTICNLDGSLEYQGYASNIDPPWTITPPQISDNCALHQATDFTFSDPKPVPFLQGTVTWHAAVDQSIAEIGIDLDPAMSGWFNTAFCSKFKTSCMFETSINCTVVIGATNTETTSWSEVKGLFR